MTNALPSYRRAVVGMALAVALGGAIVGVGSYFRFPVVSWWVLGILPSPLAALAFAFAGLALTLHAYTVPPGTKRSTQRVAIARGLTGIVMAFGLLVVAMAVAGYALQPDFRATRIDQLPASSRTATKPLAGACFFLLGSGLLFIGTKRRLCRMYAHAVVGLVTICSVLAVLSALFECQLFLGHRTVGPVSYLLSLAFVAVCAGYYLLETDADLVATLAGNSTGAIVARRLLPAALIVPPVVGWASRLAELRGFWLPALGEAIEALMNILVFTALIGWTAQRLFEADAERRRAELSMRESEEQFSEAFQHSPIGVALVACDGRWLKINPALCELLGYPEAELSSRTFLDLTHPEDRNLDRLALGRLLTGEIRNHQVQKRYLHSSGRTVIVIVSVSLIRDEQGRPRHFITQVQDITERALAEEALRESEARYQRIAANVPGMVYRFTEYTDGTRALLFVSEGCREIYGVEPQQLRDEPDLIARLIHPEDRAEYLRSVQAAVASASAWNWQGRVRRHDTGEIRSIQGASRPERQSTGDVLWDGVIIDITERQQAEENRRAKEEAERTNLAKSKFLSRMSHELRTPLNAILGFGQLLQLSPLREDDAIAVDHILKGGGHLLSLVDEVLDLSRAEAGELRLHTAPVDVNDVAQECIDLVARLAAARDIRCKIVPTWPTLVLWTDEQRVRQILLNLISNGIKYNRAGGSVTVHCELLPAERVRINVTDTGEGIDAAGLTKLFVPFERLQQEDGAIEGTGLGLVVSQRIAEALGGSVGVRSTPGVGSTFWLELPVTVAPADPALLSDDSRRRKDEPIPEAERAQKILYVEDNASNLAVVRMLLSSQRPHWEFLSAVNGKAGLEQARRLVPDVILLDYQLPDMRGDQVLEILRRESPTRHIPVIMLSADATAHSRERLLREGAEVYLTKPFVAGTLLSTLEHTLASGTKHRQARMHGADHA